MQIPIFARMERYARVTRIRLNHKKLRWYILIAVNQIGLMTRPFLQQSDMEV